MISRLGWKAQQQEALIMANKITIFRIFLIFLAAFLLFGYSSSAYIWALILTVLAFALDGVDGYVARKFNESSKLGAMLDIMSDRIAENTLWVVFAVLGWLPVVFPLISITRGFITDGIRSVAMEQGFTAFGETSLQDSKWGAFICSSKFSRISYAVAKVIAFVLMIFSNIPDLNPNVSEVSYKIAYGAAVFAIIFCIVRGLPVVLESKKLFVK